MDPIPSGKQCPAPLNCPHSERPIARGYCDEIILTKGRAWRLGRKRLGIGQKRKTESLRANDAKLRHRNTSWPGRVPAINVLLADMLKGKTWMPGIKPGMTVGRLCGSAYKLRSSPRKRRPSAANCELRSSSPGFPLARE